MFVIVRRGRVSIDLDRFEPQARVNVEELKLVWPSGRPHAKLSSTVSSISLIQRALSLALIAPATSLLDK